MQIKIISVPVVGGEAANEELNAFLRSRKILEVAQQLVQSPGGAYWSFCIRYIEKQSGTSSKGRQRTDYKQLLSREAFQRFARYRAIRKQVAQEDGVPPFAVFTDKELAGLAELEELTPAAMQSVKGIGEKKVEKYAARFIKAISDEKSE